MLNYLSSGSANKSFSIYLFPQLAIEPISGSALKVEDRSQMNCAIPEQTVSAPRQRPLNITYKEKRSSTHFSQVIPFLWVDVRAVAPTKQLEIFGIVSDLSFLYLFLQYESTWYIQRCSTREKVLGGLGIIAPVQLLQMVIAVSLSINVRYSYWIKTLNFRQILC